MPQTDGFYDAIRFFMLKRQTIDRSTAHKLAKRAQGRMRYTGGWCHQYQGVLQSPLGQDDMAAICEAVYRDWHEGQTDAKA